MRLFNLLEKPEVLALNKCDALTEGVISEKSKALKEITGKEIIILSSISHQGVPYVLENLFHYIINTEINKYR